MPIAVYDGPRAFAIVIAYLSAVCLVKVFVKECIIEAQLVFFFAGSSEESCW